MLSKYTVSAVVVLAALAAQGAAAEVLVSRRGAEVNQRFPDNSLPRGYALQRLAAAEDRGDGLHIQANKFDSIWSYDVRHKNRPAVRLAGLGRDPSAEIDAVLGLLKTTDFQNDGDNEPTGLHYSDGDTAVDGLLGSKRQRAKAARLFFTQQHGENVVWEILGRNL